MKRLAPAVAIGGTGTLVVLGAALAVPEQALAAWLAAVLAISMLPTGTLALLLAWHLHRGRWGIALGPAMTAAVGTMPLAALAMLPILLFADALYPWAGAAGARTDAWLAQPAFALRGLAYLAPWCLLAHLAVRAGVPAEGAPRRPALASIGLIVYALTASFAGIDWALSLQPEVSSSIFGLIFVCHQMLGAFAFLVLLSWPRIGGAARGIGNMLLGGTMLWLYLEYMQYLIVWSGDLPGRIEFYLARTGGLATAAVWLAAAGGGAAFVLLLWSRVRDSAPALATLALLLLAGRHLEAAWWVLPVVPSTPMLPWLTAAALAGAGGLWLAGWHWRLNAKPTRAAPAHG